MENELFDVFGLGNDRPSTIAGSPGEELLPGTIDIIPGGQGAMALEMQGSDLLGGNLEPLLLGAIGPLEVTVANNEERSLVLDIDRNGRLEALTDGIMIIRHLFGFAGDVVVRDAVAPDGTRTDAAEITSYLDELGLLLDVDGDGQLTALTDGIMIIRDLFGFAGDIVIRDAVAPGAPRDTVSEVTAYLTELKSMTLTPEPEPETLPIVEVSPANGEEMVNLTRETVVRFGEKVDPATVNDESFFLIANGERVGGRIDVSSTEEFATFFYDEPLPGATEVRVVVEGDAIIGRDGDAIDADGDGNAGGTLTADFRTLPLTRIEGTDVFGFVFDSFNTNADGSNIPIVGATIRVDAFPEANAVTDENGFFRLEDVPAPEFSVHIDGSTASNAPDGTVYATVGKLFESVPGQETQLTMDGETFDIFLPPLATGDIQELSPTEETDVGFGNAGVAQLEALFPDVDASVWELTQVTFPPGSAQDEDGNAATQATIIPVDPERLPAPLPPGVELPLVISIQAGGEAGFSQAGGATNFDVPAPVSFPNLEGLAPGEKSLIISFDHDRGEWIPVGSGTVSSDGTIIESDPGVGILAPGWHGAAPGAIGQGDVPFTFGDPNRPVPPPSDPNEPPPSDPNEPPPSDPNEPVPLGGRHFFVLENLETGFIFRGFANLVPGEALCGDGVILSPNTSYRQWVFNVDNGLIGFSEFATPASGSNFDMPDIILESDSNPDGDGDGLSDTAEFIIGTSSDNADSDNDGINDGAEIQQGLEPLDDLSFPTGIISSLPLQGEANAVVVAGSTLDGQGQTAYVATGSQGLAIVDASVFNNPIVLGQLDLSGDATDVAVDANLQIAAVASNGGGLQLVDVSDPMVPTTSNTVNISANQVEIADGIAYATVGNSLRAIDLLTGEELNSITLPGSGTVTDISREGTSLYAFTSGSDTFSVIDIADEQALNVLGQVEVNIASFQVGVFAANGVAYLAGSGLRTIDVSDPSNPSLLGDAEEFFTARDVALNGSGLALVAAENQGLGIYDVTDPQDTDALLTQIDTPGFARDVAIASGIAFVADGSRGLQAINYLPFDNQGEAPTITISSGIADLDPNSPGVQVTEGSSIPVFADVTDDVQVRNVELLVDGEVVSNAVSFPFDLTAIALSNDPNADVVQVQGRATDTGGNTALSNILTFDLVPDTFAPVIESITPEDGQEAPQNTRVVEVRFNEALDEDSVTTTNFQLRNADGQFVAPENIQLRGGDRTVQLTYEPLPVGDYSLIIDASQVSDRAGNVLGEQDVISEFSLIEGTIFWVGGSGDWNDPDNWDTGQVPGPDDLVAISVPGDATITYDSRFTTTSVAAIFSQENLVISDGTLRVTGDSEFNNGFTLTNGTLDADGEIIVAGNSSWRGGTLAGDAELINTGTLDWTGGTLTGNLANTGTFTISGDSSKSLGGVLNNTGTITHNATGDVDFNNGTLNNQIGGVYDFQAGVLDSNLSFSSTGNVNNSGLFRKSGEGIAATVDVDFNLTGGTTDVQAGTLRLIRGGTSTGGNYNASASGVLDYSGGTHNFSGNYSGSGEGKVRINGATISNPEGETANFNLTGNLFEWIAGRIDSDGGLTNTGTLNISGEDDKFLIGTFNNTGTIVHTSGVVDSTLSFASTGTLNNSGTYRKSGEGIAATVDVDFDLNGGTIDVQAGTLLLTRGGTSTGGRYSAAAGGVLDYSGGTHNFRGTYTGEGEGKVRINGATISDLEGETASFNITGNLFEWIAGRIDTDGGLTNTGTLNISGEDGKFLIGRFNNTGTIVHTSGVVDSTLSFASTGTLNNSGTYRKSGEETAATVDVDFDLTGGTIDVQAGTLQLTRGGTNTGGNYIAADGGALEYTGGTHNFRGEYSGSGEGKVRINGATISNREGETANFNLTGNLFEWTAGRIDTDGGLTNTGILNISGEDGKFVIGTFNNTGTIVHTSGVVDSTLSFTSTGNVNNSGTYRKSGGGTAAVDVDFDLTGGTIDVQAGTLELTRGGISTGGNYIAAAGGALEYTSGTHNFRGDYSGSGEGKVRINGATISNREGETANFNLTGNLFEWTGGTIDSDEGLTNSGTLTLSGAGSKFLDGILNNSGTIVHTSGILDSRLSFTSTGTLNNSGTYRKSGEDTSTIDIDFNNNGTAQVQQGTLRLTRSGTSSGAHTIASNSVLEYSGGTHTLTGDYSVSGAGTVRLSSGTLNVSSDGGASFNPGTFDRTGGTFVES